MKSLTWTFVVVIAISCISALSTENVETTRYPAADVQNVEVQIASGDVHVAPTLRNTAAVTVVRKRWSKRCQITTDFSNGRLRVALSDAGWLQDQECRVDVLLSVPPTAALAITGGTSDVKIVGSRGDVAVKLESGRINVKGEIKNLTATTDAGDVTVEGSSLASDIKTKTGDISLALQPVPGSASELSLNTGSGDVALDLPESALVQSTTTTGNGHVTNEFAPSPLAQFKVKAISDEGNIQIRRR